MLYFCNRLTETHTLIMAQKTDNVFLTNLIEDLPVKDNYRLGDTTSLIYCKHGSLTIELEQRTVKARGERPDDMHAAYVDTFVACVGRS